MIYKFLFFYFPYIPIYASTLRDIDKKAKKKYLFEIFIDINNTINSKSHTARSIACDCKILCQDKSHNKKVHLIKRDSFSEEELTALIDKCKIMKKKYIDYFKEYNLALTENNIFFIDAIDKNIAEINKVLRMNRKLKSNKNE